MVFSVAIAIRVSVGHETEIGMVSVTGAPAAPAANAVASNRPAAVAVTVVSVNRTIRLADITRTNGFTISFPAAS